MYPRTVEEVIKDFKGRRAGIIKALTKDAEELYKVCDPNNPNLCLYGFPNQQWEVNLPPPSDLPEPRLGINFARDTMPRHEWLAMVALHSDVWLQALVSYFATKFKFDKADKKRLFNKIVDLPSICEVMHGKGRKRDKIESGGLPEDILVEEVLARLTVRDLHRYRLVCKKWRSLIDDQDFVSTHLRKYNGNCDGSRLLVLERPKGWLREEHILVRRSDTYRKVIELEHLVNHEQACYLSYINGLILVRKGNLRFFREIILWNPSINRSLKVPNSIFQSMREATYFELGLGFDASSEDYKVVAIVYPHAEIKYHFGQRYRATIQGLVQVYTLSTSSWSSNLGVSPPPYWTVGSQVFVNGSIHWLNFGPNIMDDSWYTHKDSYIVSFDVGNEVFNYLELPSGINNGDHNEPIKETFPTIFEGSLAMFCAYQSHNEVWVMKEYGVPNSWSKCYKFSLSFDKLLLFKNNGELLFALDGKGIKSYDVKRKWVRDLAKTYCKSSHYTVYTYVESLVLSKDVNKETIESSVDKFST